MRNSIRRSLNPKTTKHESCNCISQCKQVYSFTIIFSSGDVYHECLGFDTFGGGVCIEWDAYNWGNIENRKFIRRRVGDWKFLCQLRDMRHRVQVTMKIIGFLNRRQPISQWIFFGCFGQGWGKREIRWLSVASSLWWEKFFYSI